MFQPGAYVPALAAVGFLAAAGSQHSVQGSQEPLVLTHGIASGDVTDSSAVIWGRANRRAQMHVEIASWPFRRMRLGGTARASVETDFTAQVKVEGLEPDTRYWYRVWLSGAGGRGRSDVSQSTIGTFTTAPAASQSRAVSFIVGADVGGQRFCRNATTGGYTIFASMAALAPDFFIANGDMIYADGDCPAEGPDGPGGWENIPGDFPNVADPSIDWTDSAQVREIFLRHYRYNRADPFYQAFLSITSMYSQWDDHEVINDFGAPWTYWNSANLNRPGYPNLVAQGLDTFFAYSPIDRFAGDRNRIYRSFRWGRDVDAGGVPTPRG